MKRILMMALALTMLLAGCSTEVTEYRQQQPRLDIFHYFGAKPKRGDGAGSQRQADPPLSR